MERRSVLKWLAGLTAGILVSSQTHAQQPTPKSARLGQLLTPKYRDVIYLMSKTTARNAKDVRSHLEESLKRLKTDYLDLWQVHAVNDPKDVDKRINNGVFEVMRSAQESGLVRHIGFTGHRQPEAHLRVLEKSDIFNTCQMPINLADPSYSSFIKQVLPKLMERNIGVIAMKSLANGGFFGGSSHGQHGNNPKIVPNLVSIAEAVSFVWSLPVSVLITGFNNPQQMKEKIALANSFVALEEQQRQNLIDKVANLAGRRVEFYKA